MEILLIILGVLFTFGVLPACIVTVAGLFGLTLGYFPALAIVILANFLSGLVRGKK